MRLPYFIIPSIEIAIIAMVLYTLLSLFWNTRTMDLMIGLGALFVCLFAVNYLRLPVLQKMMAYIGNVAFIAVIIIFQPELRFALSKLSVKGKKFREISEFDRFLDALASSVYRMSEKKVGALIVLENQDNLEDLANKAVRLDSLFSSELLESIFSTSTPLHDGAVILRANMILSAATILPLADDSAQLSKSMGTRHRAGLGMSQISDSVIIVVSEESGKVSIAREGIITSGVKIDRFKGILRSIFTPPKQPIPTRVALPRYLQEQLRRWTA